MTTTIEEEKPPPAGSGPCGRTGEQLGNSERRACHARHPALVRQPGEHRLSCRRGTKVKEEGKSMHHNFNFKDVLAISSRPSWAIEDVLPPGAQLDFSRRFMPENLARTAAIPFLDEEEARVLNQIRGHEYLALFGLVEEFILPFVLDHARPQLSGDDHRVRALLQFAGEEAKHIHLFKQFHSRFTEGFGDPVRGDRPARGDRRRGARPRSARRRAGDPPPRVDDPEPLCRQRPGRRRPRSPVQEPAQASLDGGGAARQARHVDGRGAGGRPRRGRHRARDRRISRDRHVPRRRPQGTRPGSTSTRSSAPPAASSARPSAKQLEASSTRRCAGPISAPA